LQFLLCGCQERINLLCCCKYVSTKTMKEKRAQQKLASVQTIKKLGGCQSRSTELSQK
jgi:hypothetical protein